MNQVLHILKKDVRYLRNEIGLLCVLSLLFAWTATHQVFSSFASAMRFQAEMAEFYVVSLLVTLTAAFLIALVIHAEALPGDKQFWITRPYRWSTLLASKLLFIFLFVNLPVFFGRLLIVVFRGIPLLPSIPGLVSSQAWLLLAWGLPTAVVAALTPGLVPFLFTMIGLFVVGSSGFSFFQEFLRFPQTLEWVRDSMMLVALMLFSGFILYFGYKGRRVQAVRALGIVTMGALLLLFRFLPLSFATDLQTAMSPQPSTAAAIQATISEPAFWAKRFVNQRFPELGFGLNLFQGRLDITGVPSGLEIQSDALEIALRAPDGRTWSSGVRNLGTLPLRGYQNHWDNEVDQSFVDAEHDKPLTVTGSAYLTLFENTQSVPFTPGKPYATVVDDLQCGIDWARLLCRSVSTLSHAEVYEQAADGRWPLQQWISYAPYPLGLVVSPLQDDSAESPSARLLPPSDHRTVTDIDPRKEVTLVVMRPIAHLRRDFQLTGIRLDDIKQAPSPIRRPEPR